MYTAAHGGKSYGDITGHVGAGTRRLPRVDARRTESCVSGPLCTRGTPGRKPFAKS